MSGVIEGCLGFLDDVLEEVSKVAEAPEEVSDDVKEVVEIFEGVLFLTRLERCISPPRRVQRFPPH